MRPVRRRSAICWLTALLGLLLVAACSRAGRAEQGDLWVELHAGRAAAVLRHALAPGTGDPDGFQPGDCATQRNLSAEGRRQAEAIGRRFREQGIVAAAVYSSQWCRCLETARLLALGPVIPLPALNSLFGKRSKEDEQSAAVRQLLQQHDQGRPIVLVTHQANIGALTDTRPRSGEIVAVRVGAEGGLEVLGRLAPPE